MENVIIFVNQEILEEVTSEQSDVPILVDEQPSSDQSDVPILPDN